MCKNVGGETAVCGVRKLVEKRPFCVMKVGVETAVSGVSKLVRKRPFWLREC